jgi:hypothetical protein
VFHRLEQFERSILLYERSHIIFLKLFHTRARALKFLKTNVTNVTSAKLFDNQVIISGILVTKVTYNSVFSPFLLKKRVNFISIGSTYLKE